MDLEIVIDYVQEEEKPMELCESFDEYEQKSRLCHVYMNRGSRREMLDRFQIMNNHYGIFDGHGSADVADYLSKNLLQGVQNGMSETDYKRCKLSYIFLVFNDIDANLSQYTQSGSVALLLSIQNKTVTITSLGDSRAIVIRDDSSQQLNSVHTPQIQEEKRRIQQLGGLILTKQNISRVSGQLAVSRSFGDYNLKKFIISDPEVSKYEITDTDRYIVMASDGFWDELSEQQVRQLMQKVDTNQNMAKQLYQAIQKEYIRDNVTIIVIPL